MNMQYKQKKMQCNRHVVRLQMTADTKIPARNCKLQIARTKSENPRHQVPINQLL